MIIELRVHRAGVNWEQIEPIRADIGTSNRAKTLVKRADSIALALAKGNLQEVRWSFCGSSQGHYVGGFYRMNREAK